MGQRSCFFAPSLLGVCGFGFPRYRCHSVPSRYSLCLSVRPSRLHPFPCFCSWCWPAWSVVSPGASLFPTCWLLGVVHRHCFTRRSGCADEWWTGNRLLVAAERHALFLPLAADYGFSNWDSSLFQPVGSAGHPIGIGLDMVAIGRYGTSGISRSAKGHARLRFEKGVTVRRAVQVCRKLSVL